MLPQRCIDVVSSGKIRHITVCVLMLASCLDSPTSHKPQKKCISTTKQHSNNMDTAPVRREDGDISPQVLLSAFVRSRLTHVWDVASRDQPNRVTDARQAIDQELATMHLAMCALRTHRNTLAPISRLPSETVARIFWFCGDKTPQGWGTPNIRFGWILVTHICRHWRDIALQHHSLWSTPDRSLGPEWLRLMLSRSKTAPVVLALSTGDSSPDDTYDLIAKHISHIRALTLSGEMSKLNPIVETLTSSTHSLESLCLQGSARGSLFSLPDKFRNMFPRLRHLHLRNISTHWSSPVLGGLTRLELAFQHPGQNDRTQGPQSDGLSCFQSFYDQFFCALERMPTLEALILQNALPSRDQHPFGHHVAMLACLKTLSLYDKTRWCFDVVKRLIFPSSCHVHLDCNGADGIQHITTILPVLSKHARAVDKPSPVILSILIQETHFQLKIWGNRDLLGEAWNSDPHPPADLSFSIRHPDDSAMDRAGPLQALCDALPLVDLPFLLVCHKYKPEYTWTSKNWIDLFSQCRAVKHVYIIEEATSFISALGLPDRHGRSSEQDTEQGTTKPAPPFLKDLLSLTLTNVSLYARQDPNNTKTSRAIVEAVAARKNLQGVNALPTICICRNCFSSETGTKEELSAVSEVVWLKDYGHAGWTYKFRCRDYTSVYDD